MSRVGKKPIIIPSGVSVKTDDAWISVTGPKGTLTSPNHPKVKIDITESAVNVSVGKPEDRRERALWGLYRALVANMVDGVVKGFEKKLEVNGVGFKIAIAGSKLVMSLGFSHPVEVEIPKELTVTVDKNIITIAGSDKQMVGQFAANVRSLKKPEPYKGKGIKYVDEVILRKAGKVVKAVGK